MQIAFESSANFFGGRIHSQSNQKNTLWL